MIRMFHFDGFSFKCIHGKGRRTYFITAFYRIDSACVILTFIFGCDFYKTSTNNLNISQLSTVAIDSFEDVQVMLSQFQQNVSGLTEVSVSVNASVFPRCNFMLVSFKQTEGVADVEPASVTDGVFAVHARANASRGIRNFFIGNPLFLKFYRNMVL